MSTMTEKFCLRWNDFETNISSAFRELREEKDFFDVTLACDDSQVQAHKVILSACSPFFRNILRQNPHQHPLLYMKGVKYSELLAVLNFMYMGEVNVGQEELNSFLSVAEDLKVKGLTQNNSKEHPEKNQIKQQETGKRFAKSIEIPKKDSSFLPKKVNNSQTFNASRDQSTIYQQEEEIQEILPVKSEPGEQVLTEDQQQQVYHQHQQPQTSNSLEQESVHGTVALHDNSYTEEYDYGQYEGYDDGSGGVMLGELGTDTNKDDLIRSKMFKNDHGLWQCLECTHTSQFTTNMKNHIEVKHVGSTGYFCKECNKFCSSKNALNNHRTRYRH